ncbi:MAG: LexA repressor [Phycisphaerae bacterium]
MEPLTDKQRRVYDEVEARISAGGLAPTLRELCSHFRWSSTGTARDALNALVRKGYLQAADGRARGYRLVRRPPSALRVPLLGQVPAGVPVEAVEVAHGDVPVPEPIVSASANFALRVTGDSMTGASIQDGDLVFVRQQAVAEPGQIVVARVDGEVTVKRLRRQRGRLALVPENPSYRPIPVTAGTEIVGVVVGLVRGYDGRSVRV